MAPTRKRRKRARVPRLGRAWLLVLAAVVAFLYYRPLASWLETRAELDRREVEVVAWRAEKTRLVTRLERASSLEALGREARCIGYVRPGEQLFIVTGIPESRRRCGATLGGDG